jgi:hypothetical protein
MRDAVGSLLGKELFIKTVLKASKGSGSDRAEPDGLLKVVCLNLSAQPVAYYAAEETKSETGEGGSDSVAQAECDYRAVVCRDEVRPPFHTPWLPLSVSDSTRRFEELPVAPCSSSQIMVRF